MADLFDDNSTPPDITQDEEYADLIPILQDDGENPVVAIRYSKEFSDVHNYFRAVVHKNELSERALKLSERVIKLNAANYTAWQFRRECIFKTNYDLYKELEFSKEIAKGSPKNYQLWWHRRIIIEAINKPSNDDNDNNNNENKPNLKKYDLNLEKELLRSILKSDAKNYHAWSHYHWILRTYKLYDDELEYLEKKLLLYDVRNNSAWNHRHFVVKQTTGFNDLKVLQREIEFCRGKIEVLATNHAVWYYYTQIVTQYLKGLCNDTNKPSTDNDDNNDEQKESGSSVSLSWTKLRQEQIKWIQSILDKQPYAPRASLFYIDLLTDKDNTNINDLNQAKALLVQLSEKIDRIRYNYYGYLIKGVEQQIQQLQKQ